MSIVSLFIVGIIANLAPSAAPERIVLHNAYLTVAFETDDTGLCLTEITCRKTGKVHLFVNDRPVSLFAVPPDAIHDPNLPVKFSVQKGIMPDGIEVSANKTHASVRLHNDLLQIETRYQLDPHMPVLRKTIHCKANDKPVYIAGVRQWALTPVDSALIWPKKNGGIGQPAVLLHDDEGYVLTLEWPRARVVSKDGEIRLSYRPGYLLAPGQARAIAAGSILLFEKTFEKDALDAARHAFFAHMRARVQPKVPCPIKFTTWGPWMKHTNADRILEVIDDLAYVGTDLLHYDAGWQWPDYPYSKKLPRVIDADDQTWDLAMTQPERLPNGLLPLVKAAKARDMALSLWFDAVGCVYVRETEDWAVRNKQGDVVYHEMWGKRWPKAPLQSLTSEYEQHLREFVKQAQRRYDLGGVMFDNDRFKPNHATDHNSLASGWDSEDVQCRVIMEILDECEQRHPGIYRFFCHGASWPWALLHATHIHAGDPGTSKGMHTSVVTDHPARALAHERRLAWQTRYRQFVPPWGVKGDIAGWSIQQMSAIPVNLKHTDELIAAGEGWTQNMFTCFATTCVRDIRFSFRQMPRFDREILKEWLTWGQRRAPFIFNCRPLFDQPKDPNHGVAGFSHVGQGRGVIYLFNCSFDAARAQVKLDERAGFTPTDQSIPAYIVYPMKARVAGDTLSYGQVLDVPLAPKDCLVIEVGLEEPEKLAPYAEYVKAVASVKRSFNTQFTVSADDIIKAMKPGSVRIEVGDTKGDRRLAATIIETLGAGAGQRMSLEECLTVPAQDATCRLIIGTHDGLSDHPDVGKLFRETLYERYLLWDQTLLCAPLAAELPGITPNTFCLIAPRPEQLARLSINLSAALAEKAQPMDLDRPGARWNDHSITATVPARQAVLRFRPLMRTVGAITMPGDLDFVRYEIHAQRDGKQTLLWREDIPPFFSRNGNTGWWGDRLISVADLAGQNVTFHFSAAHKDGRRNEPMAQGGFDHVALLQVESKQ